jgi:hypothetical protein
MPIDRKNISEKDPNQIPYFRNDTISPTAKPNPATFDRAESHKNDSHYSGDNARESLTHTEPEYENPYKQVKGVLDVGMDSDIWQYDDKTIINKLQKKIAKKFNVNPAYVKVSIDRYKGKISYDRSSYVQSTIKADKADEIDYSTLSVGEKFLIGLSEYRVRDDMFKKKYPREKVWIKVNDKKAKGADGNGEVSMSGNTQVELHRAKVKVDKTKITTFSKVPVGALFVFVDMPQSLQYKSNPNTGKRTRKFQYDQKFKKINDNQAQVGNEDNKKVIDMESARMQSEQVMVDEEWQKKYQYKKENIETALDSFFDEYKTSEDKYGEVVMIPTRKDFYDKLEAENVSEAKINSLAKEDKDGFWRGSYNGQYHNYIWNQKMPSKEEVKQKGLPEQPIELTRISES